MLLPIGYNTSSEKKTKEGLMRREDWTLLVIAAGGSGRLSPVKLQKSLFLLGKELSGSQLQCGDFYDFQAYDYGPFAREIYSDAEFLESQDLVSISRPINSYRRYRITTEGLQRAGELRSQLTTQAASYLDEVVQWTQRLPFDVLISAIYKAYPDMKVNSVFRD